MPRVTARDPADRRPFAGLHVLDLTRVLAGPYAAYQLALMGADVLKIEKPGSGDSVRWRSRDAALGAAGMATQFLAQAGNKRCMAIDLDLPAGREILLKLVAQADVLIENFRAGALARRGLDHATLRAANARLIHCTITGFGRNSSRAAYPAYDPVIQAASGLMSLTGTAATGPLKTGAPIVDYATGMAAAMAIAAALHQRSHTGEGQCIDVAMQDVALGLMSNVVAEHLTLGTPARSAAGDPLLDTWPTRDGLLTVAALEEHQVRALLQTVEKTAAGAAEGAAGGLADDARFGSYAARRAHAPALGQLLAPLFLARSAHEWEALLNQAGVPAARVRSVAEAIGEAEVEARSSLHRFARIEGAHREAGVTAAPFAFAHDGPRVDHAPRPLGADTDATLAALGLDAEAIAALRVSGAVG